jgi:ABC-type uncharacterized transport system substrate-binding protein
MKYFLVLLVFITNSFAHPHTFIEVSPTIKVKDHKVVKLHFQWKIDEMTSSMLIMEFDQDGDGEINAKENSFVYSSYFTSLKDYNFFTIVKQDGKRLDLSKPKNFKASIIGEKICYDFDIEKEYNAKNLSFEFGDTSFFYSNDIKR